MTDYQFMPALSDDDYAALKADIAARGIMVPIEVDEDGNVLDGHHRLRIAEELGVSCPRTVRAGLSEREKRTHARQLNIARRHLGSKQKRDLIEAELRDDSERSNRQIGGALGVSKNTVDSVRQELEDGGQIDHHAERKSGALIIGNRLSEYWSHGTRPTRRAGRCSWTRYGGKAI